MSESVTSAREQIAFLRGLRQVRQLRPDPLPQAAIDDILDVSRWTGSARNLQPWDLVVVRDRSLLQALAQVEGGRGDRSARSCTWSAGSDEGQSQGQGSGLRVGQ